MNLINQTKMQAACTLGREPSAREHIVVAIKGTYIFPERNNEPALADEQAPLIEADTFTGEPGKSAPLLEVDFALRKLRCDVLLNGSAYAPGGKPAKKVQVGLRIGPLKKVFNVVGDRVWQSRGLTDLPSTPKPFAVMPITYDRAFGGTDDVHPNPKKHSAYMLNPVGCGYHKETATEFIDGKPLPNTEESNVQVTSPSGKYRPMSFGPVGRGWHPRIHYAGTYDQDWLDNVFPFLPADFRDEYYQSAPPDQQMPYPRGGEDVQLLNLTPEGRTRFRLPNLDLPVNFLTRNNDLKEMQAVADTVTIEPDQRRFMVTWRASLPLKKDVFEVAQIRVGSMPRGWLRARQNEKTYYRSLGELVAERRLEEEDSE